MSLLYRFLVSGSTLMFHIVSRNTTINGLHSVTTVDHCFTVLWARACDVRVRLWFFLFCGKLMCGSAIQHSIKILKKLVVLQLEDFKFHECYETEHCNCCSLRCCTSRLNICQHLFMYMFVGKPHTYPQEP